MKICTKTSPGVGNGGTDADVLVRIKGENGCLTPWQNLDSPADDFEIESYNCFEYITQSVGTKVLW